MAKKPAKPETTITLTALDQEGLDTLEGLVEMLVHLANNQPGVIDALSSLLGAIYTDDDDDDCDE